MCWMVRTAACGRVIKVQTEANDNVWVLIGNTEKAMSQLENTCKKYEDVGHEIVDVDHEVEEDAE